MNQLNKNGNIVPIFHLRETFNKERSKSVERKQKSQNQVHYVSKGRGWHTQKWFFCLAITYIWSLRRNNCTSFSLTPCMSIYLPIQLPIYIIEALILLANLHQSKGSLDEHFKLGNIKFLWQKFFSLSKVVFKTLLDLQGSF